MSGVWILADNRQLTLELLNIGRTLADEMNSSLTAMVYSDREFCDQVLVCGADDVFFLPHEGQTLDAYVPVIAGEISRGAPDVFLVGGTARGREIAARIAARLNIGLCSGCIGLAYKPEEGRVEMQRLMYGGAAVQTVVCKTRPWMATISAKSYTPASPREGKPGLVRELAPPEASPVKIIESRPKIAKSGDVREARVLVCVGRGIEKEEDLAIARDLAVALGGEMACTRPLVEEMHWLPEDTYIGLSGLQVKPELYVGIGISGQIQHMTGVREARVICAINKDENAAIFGSADYGIVGDLYEVLPILIDQVKKKLDRN